MHSLILRKYYFPPPLKSIWIRDRNWKQRGRSLWSAGLTAQTLTATICPNISLLSALIFLVKTGKGGCSFSLCISMCQADAHIKRSERWRHESEDDDVRKTTSTFRHSQRSDWYYLQGTSSSTSKCATETHHHFQAPKPSNKHLKNVSGMSVAIGVLSREAPARGRW